MPNQPNQPNRLNRIITTDEIDTITDVDLLADQAIRIVRTIHLITTPEAESGLPDCDTAEILHLAALANAVDNRIDDLLLAADQETEANTNS